MRKIIAMTPVLAAALIGAGGGEDRPAAAATGPCGTLAYRPDRPPHYDHVVVVMDENVTYRRLTGTTQAPYLHRLAAACGSETRMHAATHPSQPNYMAATGGWPSAVGQRSTRNNIFHQAQSAKDTWKSYQESMTSGCGGDSGLYRRGHNPAWWYSDLRQPTNTCRTRDVPLSPALDQDISGDALPTFAWITPNYCHDMHWKRGCPTPATPRVAAGDRWLSGLVPRLAAMPSYRAGRTLILLTWDEGDGPATVGVDCTRSEVYRTQPSCHIPTIVVSPYVRPGRTDSRSHDLYGLLGTVEDILGYPRLAKAIGRPGLRSGLGF